MDITGLQIQGRELILSISLDGKVDVVARFSVIISTVTRRRPTTYKGSSEVSDPDHIEYTAEERQERAI